MPTKKITIEISVPENLYSYLEIKFPEFRTAPSQVIEEVVLRNFSFLMVKDYMSYRATKDTTDFLLHGINGVL